MRAVNLIPSDAGSASRTGGLVYVLLGTLAALVVLVTLWALAGRDSTQARAELAQLQQRTESAQRAAAPLAPYQAMAQVGVQRVALVKAVDDTRYDWSAVLAATARVLPRDISLQTLSGAMKAPLASATPVPAAPAAPAAKDSAPAAPVVAPAPPSAIPTVELSGCAPNLAAVAKLMPRMRLIPGVDTVSLGPTSVPSRAAHVANTAGCTRTTFALSLTFATPVASGAPAASPAALPAEGAK